MYCSRPVKVNFILYLYILFLGESVIVVPPGKFLALVYPARAEFLLFKVKSAIKAGDGKIEYGPIPNYPVLNGGTTTDKWTLTAEGVAGLENVRGNVDRYIFWSERKDKIYEYDMEVKPTVLKNVPYYPSDSPESFFQNVALSPQDDLGTFSRIDIVQLPKCITEFMTFNPTNLNLRTFISIEYVEYNVEQVKDEDVARSAILSGAVIPKQLPLFASDSYVDREVIERLYDGVMFDVSLLESLYTKESHLESQPFLMNLYGATDGSNTTGVFELSSDIFDGTVNSIVIPKGYKAKIWKIEVDGEPCTVSINVVKGTTSSTIKTVTLSSPGTVSKEYQTRPVVVESQSSTTPTAISLAWTQSVAAESTVSMEIEIAKQ